jgi:hypothetical protein
MRHLSLWLMFSLLLIVFAQAQNAYFVPFSLSAPELAERLNMLPGAELIVNNSEKLVLVDRNEAKVEYAFHQGKLAEISMVRRYGLEHAIAQLHAIEGYFFALRFQELTAAKTKTDLHKSYFLPGSDLVATLHLNRRGNSADIVLEMRKTSHTPVYHWRKEDFAARVKAMPVAPMLRSRTANILASRIRPEGPVIYFPVLTPAAESFTRR